MEIASGCSPEGFQSWKSKYMPDPEKKEEGCELIHGTVNFVESTIASPMSPNNSTAQPPSPIVEDVNSTQLKNNSQRLAIRLFDFKSAETEHLIFDRATRIYAALTIVKRESGIPFEIVNKHAEDRVAYKLLFFECSEDYFNANESVKPATTIKLDFESEDDVEKVIEFANAKLKSLSQFELIKEAGSYHVELFDLCSLIKSTWFEDRKNIFQFSRMVAELPQTKDKPNSHTYGMIMRNAFGEGFDERRDMGVYYSNRLDTKYPITTSISTLKAIAGGCNPEGYKAWRSKYDPDPIKVKKEKPDEASLSREESFESTFESQLIVARLGGMLACMDMTFDDFKAIMVDDSYQRTEFAFWFEKHITPRIKNSMSLDRLGKFRHFEQMIKTIKFADIEIAQRFIALFINEYFLFFVGDSKHCYIKRTPTDDNSNPLESVDMGLFTNIKLQLPKTSITMKEMLCSVPYHQFDYASYVWNMDPADREAFSMAYPFNLTGEGIDDDVKLEDLPENLVYYLKHIICNDCEDRFQWLMNYLANLIHQPNKRTGVMLVLYSQANRVGKSTFSWILKQIMHESNVVQANHLSEVFGVRGCPKAIGKRLIWFEELSASSKEFREYMDKMKTAITDDHITYRALYREYQKCRNTNEYIAATNHLVGVLERRMTVFDVNCDRQGDRQFYGELRATCTTEVLNKFVKYLKQFTTSLPMNIIETEIFKNMLSNSSEPIGQYCKDLSQATNCDFPRYSNGKFTYTLISDLYESYTMWCRSCNEKILSQAKFVAKVLHYGTSAGVEKIRVRHYDSRPNVFKFNSDFFENTDDIIPVDE
jgi:hypothetical protein